MPNITFSLDEETIRDAKIAAAKLDTSVNAIVRVLLKHFSQDVESIDENALGNFQTLFDFSIGKINYRQAQKRLGVNDRTLFIMMCKAGLPMPRLSERETERLAQQAEGVLFHDHPG